MNKNLRIVAVNVFGVVLWSVEDRSGIVYKYCDTKEQALKELKSLNESDNEYYLRVRRETLINNEVRK